MNILVCVKRVPLTGGKIVLTDDERAISTRHLGFTISPHEECGCEEAVRLVEQHGGSSTVLTLGPPEAEEQLRDMMAIGIDRAVHLVTDGEEWDPQATANAIVEAIQAPEGGAKSFDLLLFGNESADAGNYQVAIRVAHRLGPPGRDRRQGDQRAGRQAALRAGGAGRARRVRGADARGGRRSRRASTSRAIRRCPDGCGPSASRSRPPARSARNPASRWSGSPSHLDPASRPRSSATAPVRRPRSSACCTSSDWCEPMVLVFAERSDDELFRQAIAFARGLSPDDVRAVGIDDAGGYSPDGTATALAGVIRKRAPSAVVAPGTERGNEVLAHVSAELDLPMAANCVSVTPGDPLTLTRMRWGGSLLEDARLHGTPALLTAAPHAVAADAAADAVDVELVPAAQDGRVRVSERVEAVTAGVSLADADVVVSGGRGVGSAEGFAVIEELAALLGAAVGCSRAVTSAGWRPHTDQVGQTGTKISPSLYIACGISGATQHMAGCKGAKKLLAINPDREASILASADFAVIGDLHEVVPAISAEIRRTRGG